MFDFDKPVVRQGTNCVKWDEPSSSLSHPSSLIPLWVADMDFEAAPAIREALRKRMEHGVFGYTIVPDSYYDSIINWYQRRHQWHIEREWIQYTTGVVPAISAVIKALTMPGEKVLILTPVYNCFFSSIRNNGCEVVESKLKASSNNTTNDTNGGQTLLHYEVDWEDFESRCKDEKTTVFLLCNPHNPAGRVWTPEELNRMNDICQRNGVCVISDEIHCELVMPGYKFTPFASINEDCAKNGVICCSPSKSFNTAGLQIANIITQNAEWRRRINRAININEICDVNPFAPVALEAAYNESEDWIDALNIYLHGNYQSLLSFLAGHLPELKVFQLEGTYLVWVDITATGMDSDTLTEKLLKEGDVWVNSGTMYGSEGYIRINIATQRERLMEGLRRIYQVLHHN